MDLIGTFEAAKFCGVTYSTISRWIDSGKIKAFRTVGLHRKVLRKDLISFMKSRNIPLGEILKQVKTNILVVGDEKKPGEMIVGILNEHEFNASFASHGFNAGVRLAETKPQLVVLDCLLPDKQISELCAQIRLLSSKAKILQVVRGKIGDEVNSQVDAGIKKPIDPEKLIKKVNDLLAVVDKH